MGGSPMIRNRGGSLSPPRKRGSRETTVLLDSRLRGNDKETELTVGVSHHVQGSEELKGPGAGKAAT